jgi:hypothetical protein
VSTFSFGAFAAEAVDSGSVVAETLTQDVSRARAASGQLVKSGRAMGSRRQNGAFTIERVDASLPDSLWQTCSCESDSQNLYGGRACKRLIERRTINPSQDKIPMQVREIMSDNLVCCTAETPATS